MSQAERPILPLVLENRAVIAITGTERQSFLEGLFTNKIANLSAGESSYAALLTPQGKLIAEMLIHAGEDTLYLDAPKHAADALHRRLMMYKMRADADIQLREDLTVVAAETALSAAIIGNSDPRNTLLGWRGMMSRDDAPAYTEEAADIYRGRRYDLGVAEGTELASEKDFWLETAAERQNGVAFDKGCYVGQELTARMKHRSKPKKMIVGATLSAPLQDIELPVALRTIEGKPAGELRGMCGTQAIMQLKLDQADASIELSGVSITPNPAHIPD